MYLNILSAAGFTGYCALNNLAFGTFMGSFFFVLSHTFKINFLKGRSDKIQEVWINKKLNCLYLKYEMGDQVEEVPVSKFMPKHDQVNVVDNPIMLKAQTLYPVVIFRDRDDKFFREESFQRV